MNMARRMESIWLAAALVLGGVWPGGAQVLAPAPPGAARNAGSLAELEKRYETFAGWKTACEAVPGNLVLRGRLPAPDRLPLPTFAPLGRLLDSFLGRSQTNVLAQPGSWVGEAPGPVFFKRDAAYFATPGVTFQPFAQKLAVPAGSEVIVRGDLHGDIHSLVRHLAWLNEQGYLRDFTVARTNAYMLFLGDYTDRGAYGTEVLYTLLRLKLANPDRVFLVRGNHEDVSLIARYGFLMEGRAKYGAEFDAGKIARIYDFLPVVVYLGSGTNYVQCNHGGMEPGYDPRSLLGAAGDMRFQLLGMLRQQRFLSERPQWLESDPTAQRLAARAFRDYVPESPTSPTVLGFMWNDFTVVKGESQFNLDPDRAFIYGDEATRSILREVSAPGQTVQAVLRGHQHSSILTPMMRRLVASSGLFRHWQERDSLGRLNAPPKDLEAVLDRGAERTIPPGSVFTFNVAPDSVYGQGCGFHFDTFAIVRTAATFDQWRIRVVNVPARGAAP